MKKFDSGYSNCVYELIEEMLTLDPSKRPNTEQILKHKFFEDEQC
jgi:serine/threonine protein kinase